MPLDLEGNDSPPPAQLNCSPIIHSFIHHHPTLFSGASSPRHVRKCIHTIYNTPHPSKLQHFRLKLFLLYIKSQHALTAASTTIDTWVERLCRKFNIKPSPTAPTAKGVHKVYILLLDRLVSFLQSIFQCLPHALTNRLSKLTELLQSQPLFQYYKFTLYHSPTVLLASLFANYVLPIILENLPWYLSPRVLARNVRDQRSLIQQRVLNPSLLQTSSQPPQPLQHQSLPMTSTEPNMALYIFSTLWNSLISNSISNMRLYIDYQSRATVKHLVLHNLLQKYDLPNNGNGNQYSFFNDPISVAEFYMATTYANIFIPNIIRNSFTIWKNCLDLYRDHFSLLHPSLILKPITLAILTESISLFRSTINPPRQISPTINSEQFFQAITSSIGDIKGFNLQSRQDAILTRIMGQEQVVNLGPMNVFDKVLNTAQISGILDDLCENFIAQFALEHLQQSTSPTGQTVGVEMGTLAPNSSNTINLPSISSLLPPPPLLGANSTPTPPILSMNTPEPNQDLSDHFPPSHPSPSSPPPITTPQPPAKSPHNVLSPDQQRLYFPTAPSKPASGNNQNSPQTAQSALDSYIIVSREIRFISNTVKRVYNDTLEVLGFLMERRPQPLLEPNVEWKDTFKHASNIRVVDEIWISAGEASRDSPPQPAHSTQFRFPPDVIDPGRGIPPTVRSSQQWLAQESPQSRSNAEGLDTTQTNEIPESSPTSETSEPLSEVAESNRVSITPRVSHKTILHHLSDLHSFHTSLHSLTINNIIYTYPDPKPQSVQIPIHPADLIYSKVSSFILSFFQRNRAQLQLQSQLSSTLQHDSDEEPFATSTASPSLTEPTQLSPQSPLKRPTLNIKPGSKPITFKRGKLYVCCGVNTSGKSTLAQVLSRFLIDPLQPLTEAVGRDGQGEGSSHVITDERISQQSTNPGKVTSEKGQLRSEGYDDAYFHSYKNTLDVSLNLSITPILPPNIPSQSADHVTNTVFGHQTNRTHQTHQTHQTTDQSVSQENPFHEQHRQHSAHELALEHHLHPSAPEQDTPQSSQTASQLKSITLTLPHFAIPIQHYRKHIMYLRQKPYIFNATLIDNITGHNHTYQSPHPNRSPLPSSTPPLQITTSPAIHIPPASNPHINSNTTNPALAMSNLSPLTAFHGSVSHFLSQRLPTCVCACECGNTACHARFKTCSLSLKWICWAMFMSGLYNTRGEIDGEVEQQQQQQQLVDSAIDSNNPANPSQHLFGSKFQIANRPWMQQQSANRSFMERVLINVFGASIMRFFPQSDQSATSDEHSDGDENDDDNVHQLCRETRADGQELCDCDCVCEDCLFNNGTQLTQRENAVSTRIEIDLDPESDSKQDFVDSDAVSAPVSSLATNLSHQPQPSFELHGKELWDSIKAIRPVPQELFETLTCDALLERISQIHPLLHFPHQQSSTKPTHTSRFDPTASPATSVQQFHNTSSAIDPNNSKREEHAQEASEEASQVIQQQQLPNVKLSSTSLTYTPLLPPPDLLEMFITNNGGNISGGFAQSVALARMFVRIHAQFIILDESLSMMDFSKFSIVFPRIVAFAKAINATVIVISHHLRHLVNIADGGVVFMDHGDIVAFDQDCNIKNDLYRTLVDL